MKRLVVLAVALVAIGGAARPAPTANVQLPCGIPDRQPLWIDFADGSVPFWSTVFARPGIVGAASNFIVPPQLRAKGANTVYFDLYLNKRVGTPSAPADPEKIVGLADKLFDTAAQSSACDKPLIALNELFGAQVPTPWTASTAQYRANVLAFVQRLAERGARPFLLLSSAPYAHGDAADWWRQVAQVADLVPEVYFSGPSVHKQGVDRGSRRLRSTMRARVRDLTDVGIPSSRIGVMLTFSSTPKAGGREGLQPLSAWLDVVKWEALAAKQVAAETGLGTIWSWGWGTWSAAGNDPDKAIAACVYLWTRDRSLCNAPAMAVGRGFDTSVAVGKALAPGTLCVLDDASLPAAVVDSLARVTGDRDVAYTAALQHLVLEGASDVSPADVVAAERDVVAARFRGSRARYLAALRRAHATPQLARLALADELRRAAVESRLRVRGPSPHEVRDFYATYDAAPARVVRAQRRVSWLGNRPQGLALAGVAPARVFALRTGATASIGGVRVTAAGDAAPLGAFPLGAALPSIRIALVAQAREAAFRTWSSQRQNQALPRLSCANDDLPQPAPVDLVDWLPFLALR